MQSVETWNKNNELQSMEVVMLFYVALKETQSNSHGQEFSVITFTWLIN
jgi:hypothetical protein